MFRTMRRFKQQISEEECIRILQEEKRGILSMHGEDGYPYGIPMNHWYNPENGKLYFHCAKTGHKLDAIRNHDKVSYCVYDQGFREDGDWALNIRSVVVFCRARIVDDAEDELRRRIAVGLCRKFTDDEAFLQKELANALPRAAFLELTPDHMTGKLVNES
ncbi:MAG: pyridoxamine 5'-phosphate oxidase family protein [Eubacteriales bacterium]